MRMQSVISLFLVAILWLMVASLGGSETPTTGPAKNLPKVPLGVPETAHKTPKSNIALGWPATLPPSRKTMPAYRLLHPRLRKDWEDRVAKIVGADSTDQRRRKITVGCVGIGKGLKFRLFAGGAIHVFPTKKATPGTKERFPEPKACEAMAEAFLRERGLWEKNAVLGGVIDNTNAGTSGSMSVGYKCRLNGATLSGPGARIIVEIGRGGRIVHVYKSWPVVEKIGDYPVISPSEAVRRLNNGQGYFKWGARGKVKSLALTYYVPPRLQGSHLVPMYVVIFREPGDEQDLRGYLPAVRKEYLREREDKSSTTKPSTRPGR